METSMRICSEDRRGCRLRQRPPLHRRHSDESRNLKKREIPVFATTTRLGLVRSHLRISSLSPHGISKINPKNADSADGNAIQIGLPIGRQKSQPEQDSCRYRSENRSPFQRHNYLFCFWLASCNSSKASNPARPAPPIAEGIVMGTPAIKVPTAILPKSVPTPIQSIPFFGSATSRPYSGFSLGGRSMEVPCLRTYRFRSGSALTKPGGTA